MQPINDILNRTIIISYTVMNKPVLFGPDLQKINSIHQLNYSISSYSKNFLEFIDKNSSIYLDRIALISNANRSLYFCYCVFGDLKTLTLMKLKFTDQIIKLEPYVIDTIKNYFTNVNIGELNE